MKQGWLRVLGMLGVLLITACTAINSSHRVQTAPNARWGIATFANNTEVPQAGNRATSITAGILRARGLRLLPVYTSNTSCAKLIVCPNKTTTIEEVLSWARGRHLQYVMMGAVNEWDYKVGLDGEPIAGVALQVYQVQTGHLIWSSVGSKIGNSRSGLAVIAQNMLIEMLNSLIIG